MHTLLFAHFEGISPSPRYDTLYDAMSRLPVEQYVAVSCSMAGYPIRETCRVLRWGETRYYRNRDEGIRALREML